MTRLDPIALHQTLQEQLDKIEEMLSTLRLFEEGTMLRTARAASIRRIVVVGRHSVGKSSLLNALLCTELIPEDVLASTRGLIELTCAVKQSIYRELGARREQISSAVFKREVARSDDHVEVSTVAARWFVELPTPYLPAGVTLIDTPGFSEDRDRSALFASELSDADAVIFVLNATQLLSLPELEVAEELIAQNKRLIFVINKIDQLKDSSPASLKRLLAHANSRLEERGGSPAAVVTFSAQTARGGSKEAIAQVAALWDRLNEQLSLDASGEALLGLQRAVARVLSALPAKLDAQQRQHEEQAAAEQQRAARARDDLEVLKAQRPRLQACFDDAIHTLKRSLKGRLSSTWDQIVAELPVAARAWRSQHDPVFSAKAFADDIAAQAKQHIEREVNERLSSLLMGTISAKLEATLGEVSQIMAVELKAQDAAGGGSLFSSIQGASMAEALRDVFGREMQDDAMGTATAAAITAAVSGVIGYIIADIILFYILGAITGFLNPVLLVAAAATGGFLYLTMGADAVRDWVRDKIVEKLGRALSAPDVIAKLLSTTDDAVQEQLSRFSAAYLKHIEEHLGQASAELQRAAAAASGHATSQRRITQQINALMAQIQKLEASLRSQAASL